MKKVLGIILSVVMILSLLPAQPVNAKVATYETLENAAGKWYKMPTEVGKSITLTVGCISNNDNMYFWGELKSEAKNYWITTVSNQEDAWYYKGEVLRGITAEKQHGPEACISQNIYTVKATLKDAGTYTIEYNNYTKNYQCIKYTAADGDMDVNDTYFHINAQSGVYYVYEGTPEENGFSGSKNTIRPIIANHGTDRTKNYTTADVNNTVPAGYNVNDATQGKAKNGTYSDYFLKNDLQTVKIDISENNLNYLLQNAQDKPYVLTKSVTIGDKKVQYAGLKTKGNNTLATTTNDTKSDRFSFTVNFGKYVKKSAGYTATQNFFGCKKISFNCMRSDRTLMREFNALRLMDKMGVPTPEYAMAKLYINNQYYGIYFMVESMESSILERSYKKGSSNFSAYLTKPTYITPYYFSDFDAYRNSNGEFTLESLKNVLYKEGGKALDNKENVQSDKRTDKKENILFSGTCIPDRIGKEEVWKMERQKEETYLRNVSET